MSRNGGREKIRLLVAGGGTGGHLYPALAIVEHARERGVLEDVLFVGTKSGIEARKVPERNFNIRFIWISGFRRSLKLQNLAFPLKLIRSLWQSYRIIKQFNPGVVLGTGGYVSGPVLYIAAKLGIPTVIQEQNSYPGVTTRLLAKRVDRVHISFDSSRKHFDRQDNLRLTGNPVLQSFGKTSEADAYKLFNLDPKKKTIVITGGSQGAATINFCLSEILGNIIIEENCQLIWSAGQSSFDVIHEKCKKYGTSIWIQPFNDNLAAAYSISDLAIARAGALTLTELAIAGIPAILIPYPYAAAQHQLHNAHDLAEKGGAVVIEEKDLTPEILLHNLKSLLADPGRLAAMRENIKKSANKNAVKDIVDSLIQIASN
jgi:UDP-N-acetylglucosamine--N-acetylmuramyl-(pentapeptide) pyrophosphoryl-undecaprenol N-acetylglucosamine transferase